MGRREPTGAPKVFVQIRPIEFTICNKMNVEYDFYKKLFQVIKVKKKMSNIE